MSQPKTPGPRRLLRTPDSPAYVKRKSPMALPGSPNRLTVPSPFLCTPVAGKAPSGTALPPSCQLVDQVAPLKTPTGKPVVQRYIPEICQPPSNASAAACTLLPKRFPRPKGNSTTQLPLIWCLVSKSDGARSAL